MKLTVAAISLLVCLLTFATPYSSGGPNLKPQASGRKSEPAPPFEAIPKIDVHSHIFEDIPELAEMLRQNNLRIINVCNRGNNRELLAGMEEVAERLFEKYGGVLPFGSTFDLTRVNEEAYSEEVIDWLDDSFEAGAVLVKIWKNVGMEIKTVDGTFILPDDPVFDPIYAHLARQGKPLLAHLAEPLDAWLPLNPESPHYGYYSNNPEWHLYGKEEFPSHADLIAARDHILEKHPDLIVIGAHVGSLEHDVDEAARRLDRYPNFYVETSARLLNLALQPTDKVRDFFIKYQDRILYGLDRSRNAVRDGAYSQEERLNFVRDLEARYRLDYQFYAGAGPMEYRNRKIQSLNLPIEVLEKFYYKNAQRLMPTLARQ
ncbi:MAG: amidohydrolase family protein [Acidobacteriota bacterium]